MPIVLGNADSEKCFTRGSKISFSKFNGLSA
jgi:hypothetical protein